MKEKRQKQGTVFSPADFASLVLFSVIMAAVILVTIVNLVRVVRIYA